MKKGFVSLQIFEAPSKNTCTKKFISLPNSCFDMTLELLSTQLLFQSLENALNTSCPIRYAEQK